MQHVLYAADFSERDRNSFEQACRFARAWRAKLLIAHVDDSGDRSREQEPRMANSLELLDIFPSDLEIDYDHILRNGDPVQVILDIEKEFDTDLIVLGTHGRKGLERVFAGSVAEQVLRQAQCPVLTVRRSKVETIPSKHEIKRRMLVPTDFSVHSYAALDFASAIANSLDAGITILHVDESRDIPINQLRLDEAQWRERDNEIWARLKKTKPNESHVDYGHKLLHGNPAHQVVQYANEMNYDYIILGTHGRTGIGRALLGSVAESVVRNANCPVISVKPSNKRSPVIHYQH